MKTSELTGALLDHWAAIAEQQQGDKWYQEGDGTTWVRIGDHTVFRPSKLWECAGPIIEREQIAIDPLTRQRERHHWQAQVWQPYACATGATALEAAMRAYVASKFGDEVPDSHEAPKPAAEP